MLFYKKQMTITYKIEQDDLLEFQLYVASKSPVLHKKRKNNKTLLIGLSAVFAGYFYSSKDLIMGSYFLVVILLLIFLYNKYFAWRQKRNYNRFIKVNYADRFGMQEHLEVYATKIHVKDNFGEGDVKASELKSIVEINSHFFINLKSGSSVIVPKAQVVSSELKFTLKSLKVPFEEEMNWNWKSAM